MKRPSSFVASIWRCAAAPATHRFCRALSCPEETQRRLLARLLRAMVGTRFAREHDLREGLTFDEYQRRVPLRTPAEYAPWLAAVEEGAAHVLTRGRVRGLLPTSGSLTGRKVIPWTDRLAREFREAINPWVSGFMRTCPAAWRGSAYWSLSPPAWPAARSVGGLPIGFASDSAYLSGPLASLVQTTLAVPEDVAHLRDPVTWQYVSLAFLLRAADLSLISVWSPTFLLALLARLPGWWDRLLEDLDAGALRPPGSAQPEHCSRLASRMGRNTRRARFLASLGPEPDLARIWPHLAAISCWCDAAAQRPAGQLAAMFPGARLFPKGLVATEGVVSIPWPAAAAPALAITSHVLEFVDDQGDVWPAWQLKKHATYRVVLTTGGGLYRYCLGDVIRVAGFLGACPLVEFVGRDGVTSDLCGEKLDESFVRRCLDTIAQQMRVAFDFALVAPEEAGACPRYALHLATEGDATRLPLSLLAERLELALQENVHYAHARRMGQLAPVHGYLIPGGARRGWERYHRRLVAAGMRSGDVKPAALSRLSDWRGVFAEPEDASC